MCAIAWNVKAACQGWSRGRSRLGGMTQLVRGQLVTVAGGCALYRALLDDADFRFVEIARVSDPARPGAYEVVHEDGTPDGSDGVLLINPFEVRAGADEAFLAGWRRVREVLAAQGGYL